MRLGITLAIVWAAALGPYVSGNLRTEQLVLYPLSIALTLLTYKKWQITPAMKALALLGMALLLGASLITLAGPTLPPGYEQASPWAGLDGIVLPFFVAMLALSLLANHEASEILQKFTLIGGIFLSANSVLALLQSTSSATFSSFWSAASTEASSDTSSIALAGAAQDRYGGVFNQSAEAGTAYGIVLIALALVPGLRIRSRFLLIPGTMSGGILSGSKIFIAAGVILLGALIVTTLIRRGRSSTWAAVASGAVILFAYQGFFSDSTSSTLDRLTSGDGFLVSLTAGRLGGDNSSLAETVGLVMSSSPVGGLGVAGLSYPYDSVYAESIIYFGVIGLVLVIVLVLILVVSLWRVGQDLRYFSRALALLLITASIGMTVFTANRLTTIVWLPVAILLSTRTVAPMRTPEPNIKRPLQSTEVTRPYDSTSLLGT